MAHTPISFFPAAYSFPRSTEARSGLYLLLTLLLRPDHKDGDREESENLDMCSSVGNGREGEKIAKIRKHVKKVHFCCEGIS